ncbi:adenosylcobinamide-phosphate synthase CbiB [Brevibacillus sp. SYSU BS000544]|uniref:adenosylcobinamide-phosphate synthase CbiB n=1 Tax=Brevibacillus sp. SYSU BS000544 TaxID=3416443 RepID=UPI003CE46E58
MKEAGILLAAYIVDRIVGDPRSLPHPVVWIGYGITMLEKWIRSFAHSDRSLRWAGLLFPLVIAGGSCAVIWLLLEGVSRIHPWLGTALEIWLISTTLATKGLAEAGLQIYHHLVNNDREKARQSLSMVVGRDTEQLDEPEICRGAVETVAENIVDAIISPLFFAAIGGAPLAFLYRATNTLDSMVGYKNDRYLYLGWASARLDDLLNYLPARITGLLLVLACGIKRLNWRACWSMILRDAKLHPSPNSGIPEAGVAGALGIQLGGLNYYKGVASFRAQMGDPHRSLQVNDIGVTVELMKLVSILAVAFFICAMLFRNSI